jgi:HAD superfamily hydrolase (TIGR01509 family)
LRIAGGEGKRVTRMIKAVIFDCDGVLVDSVGLAGEVLADYLRDLGFEVTRQEATRRFGSGKMADYVARFERETGRRLPEKFEQELRRRRELVFRQRLRSVEGAEALVRALRVPSCVASNGPMAQIELSLSIVGLRELFSERVFSAYSVRAWKPDPQLFLHAAEALGAAPSECAVLEDSELGIQAGVAAGMQVFAFLPGGGETAHANVQTLRRLSELHAFLDAPSDRITG